MGYFVWESLVYLQAQPSVRRKVRHGKRGYGAIEDQRVGVGDEQGQMRFVVKYVALHLLCLVQTDVWWVADDDVPLFVRC